MIFELSSNSNGINRKCCIKIKEKLSNGQLWKIRKKTALIELWSYFIDILAFEPGKLCPGVGILFRFFDPRAGVLH